ncbi:protein mono-ADP-ribosyltransferase PARP12-like isoform X2 [Conger conger]|nr:protein mono-ADP-ribosyltransferase PARP12-like isoform X2 [Conger conger]
MNSEHNARVLRDNHLQELDRNQLRTLLLQNDSTLLPPVCFSYNKGDGAYGNCPDQERCWRLHICDRYLRGACQAGANCRRSHDFFEPHPQKTLQERGVPSELIGSMLSVYQNIQALKNSDNGANRNQPTHAGNVNSSRRQQDKKMPFSEKTEICLFFVKGSCTKGDRCWRDHSTMPYKWEVRNGDSWTALPDNEEIERDFCDPSNVDSRGVQPVYFDTMTRGPTQVRRLSTVSSVVQPNFILTTTWAWFWQDEHNNWIQYSSVEGQHGLSSITSEDLERKYQEDSRAVMEFTAGSHAFKLSFPDMVQTNERFGTKRQVRRRPVFVSTADARRARTKPDDYFKAVPEYWDKSMLPDTGYKTIPLQESSEEYQEILALFQMTMGAHSVHSVERVQNRALWEAFQWQKDLMNKNDAGRKVNERLLFHGTFSIHVDAICQQNVGKGSYFAEDASYSHVFTGTSEVRTMFVCQVLVGYYGYGDSVLYDSCVDNIHDSSVFVVSEKHQVYPEYILKYGEDMRLSSAGAMETVTSLGLNSTQSARCASTLPTMTQNPKAKRPVTANSGTPKPVQAPPPVFASSVTPKPVQAPPPVFASSVTPKPLQAPPPVSASSVTPKPVQAPPPVSASSVTPKPGQAPPPVSASSQYPKSVQAPPPVSASSVAPKPVQAPPPVSASSVTPKPVQAPPPVRPRSVTFKPTQAPPPFTTSSVTSRVKDLGEMFYPSWGQSSDSTGTASSPSDSDGTYSQTPTSASPSTSFPGDGYSPSAATGTSSQSGSTSAMDGSRNEDGSYGAFIRRSGLDPK